MTKTLPQDLILDCIQNVNTNLDSEDMSIQDCDEKFDILNEIAGKELGDDYEYGADEDPIDHIDESSLIVATIPMESVLAWAMGDYFGSRLDPDKPESIEVWSKHVRSMVIDQDNDLICFAHGIGYDWLDNDLLGGDGSGTARAEFMRGLTITTDYGKRD